MRIESHKQWLRRLMLPSIALTFFVILWGGVLGVMLYRMLGVTISSVNGQPPTFMDEIEIHGLGGAFPATFLQCLLLLVLFRFRIMFRWWLVAILLLLMGTPLALYSGWHIARSLWTINGGGTAWESFAPQLIGLAAAWLLHIPIASFLSRYRFVVVRCDDSRKSPCPRCGYDLQGSGGTCPECGWQVPVELSAAASR